MHRLHHCIVRIFWCCGEVLCFVRLSHLIRLYKHTHPVSPTIVITGIGSLPHPPISTHTEVPESTRGANLQWWDIRQSTQIPDFSISNELIFFVWDINNSKSVTNSLIKHQRLHRSLLNKSTIRKCFVSACLQNFLVHARWNNVNWSACYDMNCMCRLIRFQAVGYTP